MRLLLPTALLLPVLLVAGCADETPEAPATGRPTDGVPLVEGTVERADDGALDASFATFRDSLRAVTAALLAVVAPDARLSFGDAPGGPDGLRQMWLGAAPPPDAHGATLWTVLGGLLDGGGVDEDGAVTVPAAAALWPDTLDAFSHVAVTGERVPARASPTDTTVVAYLRRVYLPVTAPAADGLWPVRLPDGRGAVVATTDATSPVGYRATFWDDGDGWRLRSFLHGD